MRAAQDALRTLLSAPVAVRVLDRLIIVHVMDAAMLPEEIDYEHALAAHCKLVRGWERRLACSLMDTNGMYSCNGWIELLECPEQWARLKCTCASHRPFRAAAISTNCCLRRGP